MRNCWWRKVTYRAYQRAYRQWLRPVVERLMVTLADIEQARRRIKGMVYETPLIAFPQSGDETAAWFKPENLQPIGSFKLRGASNRLAALSHEEREAGVIAYSSGNHA